MSCDSAVVKSPRLMDERTSSIIPAKAVVERRSAAAIRRVIFILLKSESLPRIARMTRICTDEAGPNT